MTLDQRDRRTLIRLLGELQDHLESAIESTLVPGSHMPTPDAPKYELRALARDRRLWKQAEDMVKKLSAKEPRR